jgi:hypothetical protein
MKRLIDDFMSENFSRAEIIRYGVVYPLLFVAVAILAGVIE